MTDRGKDHDDTVFVSGRNDFRIPYGTARLDDGCGSGVGDDVQSVTEGNESIGSHDLSSQGKAGVFCFHRGRSGRVDPAHLTGTDTERHTVATKNDGIGLDEFDDF